MEEEMRLHKYLSEQGIMSRRAAEEAIRAGRVKVNGEIAVIGQKIFPQSDVIEFDSARIERSVAKKYIMLNKPAGVVTTMNDERGRMTVSELVGDVGERVYPIGRLDMQSEGLLLMTNDGEFANHLMHPKFHKPKVYHVKICGVVPSETVEALALPTDIDGYITMPACVSVFKQNKNSTVLKIELREGRNRQIRKMCEKLDLKIQKLKRMSIGDVSLGDLPTGKWRYLTKAEVDSLRR